MITVSSSDFAEHTRSNKLVIVDFFAEWCAPCQLLKPMLEDLEADNEIQVCILNIDDNPQITTEYRVNNVPTLIFFEDGKEVERVIGVRTKQDLQEVINHLSSYEREEKAQIASQGGEEETP